MTDDKQKEKGRCKTCESFRWILPTEPYPYCEWWDIVVVPDGVCQCIPSHYFKTSKIRSRPVNINALDEVYEKFKHLDQCLSDTEWCNSGTQAIYGIAGEMWRAIKQAKEREQN
jgi:hypothetical protein